MKILITGGSGFIARNLFEQLNSEYTVISLNSKELDILDSLGTLNYIKRNKFDVIIHTATYDAAPKHSIKDPSRVLENNLKMFFNLTRCKDYFGKMIYFGSGAEFGRENWVPRMKEDYFDQHVPTDQYGFSKYIMTKYAQLSGNIYNLRLFAIFGKYDDWQTRFIPNACCNAAFGLPIKIKQNKFFDFLYIDDLVKIAKWFIENKPKEKVYNICTGNTVDFLTLAKKVLTLSRKKLEIIISKEGLGKEYSADNSKIIKEMGGYTFEDIDISIDRLYHWYLSNKGSIDRKKLLTSW